MDYKRYIEYFNEHDVFSRINGARITEMGEGYAKAEAVLDDNSMNFMGSVHGGLLYMIADIVAGCALISHGHICVTLSSSINYINPAFKGKLTAVGKEVKCGGRIGVAEVTVSDEAGNTVCVCSITMYMKRERVEKFVYGE